MKHFEKTQQSPVIRLGWIGAAGLLAATLLGACGGRDDSDDNNAPGTVPAAAAGSSLAFTDFLRGLATSDTDEPLSLEGFTAPVDDTGEPAPVT